MILIGSQSMSRQSGYYEYTLEVERQAKVDDDRYNDITDSIHEIVSTMWEIYQAGYNEQNPPSYLFRLRAAAEKLNRHLPDSKQVGYPTADQLYDRSWGGR